MKIVLFFVILFFHISAFADYEKGVSYGDVKKKKSEEMKRWPVLGRYNDFNYDVCVEESIKRTGIKQGDKFGCWRMHLENCGMTEKRLWTQLENLPNTFGLTDSSIALVLQVAQFERECLDNIMKEPYKPKMGTKKLFSSYTQNFSESIYKKMSAVNQNIAEKQKNGPRWGLRNISEIETFDFTKKFTLDEYEKFLQSLKRDISDNFFPIFSNVVTQEIKLLSAAKKDAQSFCKETNKITFEELNDMEKKCTSMNISSSEEEIFKERIHKQRDYLTWQLAQKQAKNSPREAASEKSLIEEYLRKYPNGGFVKTANNLYKKILLQEGLKEAEKDTILSLSEHSLLKKFLSKYPEGKGAEEASFALEKLLFNYSLSQINKDALSAFQSKSYPERYLREYPKGKYRDALISALDKAYWNVYSSMCSMKQTIASCKALFDYPQKFPNGLYLDSINQIIDEPMWNSFDEKECVYPEDSACEKIKKYVQTLPEGIH